jgi:hypothetical protein
MAHGRRIRHRSVPAVLDEMKQMFESLRAFLRQALDDGVSVVTFGYLVGLLGLLGLVHWLAGAGYLTLSP